MKTSEDRRPVFRGGLGVCGALMVVAATACGTEFGSSTDAALTARCEKDIGQLAAAVAVCEPLLVPDGLAGDLDLLYTECLDELRWAYEPIEGTACAVEAGGKVSEVAATVMAMANTARHDYAAVSAPLGQVLGDSSVEVAAQPLPPGDPRFADIRRRLGIINEWIDFSLDLGLPIDELPSELDELWRDAYAVPPPAGDDHVPDVVLAFLDQMDQFLVIEGLEDPDYLPLMRLHIEAIALARIAQEVETRADLVRVLCHLGDCGVTIAVRDVAQAIVALRDDDVVPPAGTSLGARASFWVEDLATAHGQRVRLQSALEELAEDAQAQLLNVWIDGLRLKLQELESDPSDRFPLATRLHDENRERILAAFTATKAELADSIGSFQLARQAYAERQIAAFGQEAEELGLGNELIRASEVLTDLEIRSGGLKRLYDEAQHHWAKLGDFTTRVDNLGLRGEVVLIPSEDPIRVPLPASALYAAEEGRATARNLPDNSVHSWAVSKGDTLRFTVSNQWSPTCALRNATFHGNPLFEEMDDDASYAETGPEGYYLQFSRSAFSAVSTTEADSDITAAGVCAASAAMIAANVRNATFESPEMESTPSAPTIFGFVGDFFSALGSKLKDCGEGLLGAGSSSSSSNTDGVETRWNAAFSSGFRLANTPFPTLPVGSLVLAVVSGGEIMDAYVVQKNAGIQMPVSGQAYLVVNDIHCGDSSGTLLVDWVRGESISDRANELATAMADIAEDAKAQIELIANARLFTSADAEEFRRHAEQRLVESCGQCNPRAIFPPAVMGMFDEWTSHEIAQLQRRVDLRRLNFEARVQLLAIESLSGQLALETEAGRWTEHLKQLAFTELSDDSLHRLENALESAAEFLDQRILPILQVRYPHMLAMSDRPTIASVADLDLSIDKLAVDFNRFVRWLDDKLRHAETGPNQETTTRTLLWIPKPGAPRTFGGGTVRVLVADDDDIANVWQVRPNGSVDLADNARIRVATRELYSRSAAVVDKLVCRRTAPIIRGMLLYAIDENNPSSGRPFEDPMNINRFSVEATLANPVFVTDVGTRTFDLVAGNTGEFRVARGTFNDRTTVADRFIPGGESGLPEDSLRGLSPFLDIQLEGAGDLNPMLRTASGLAVIMHVSSYFTGVPHCD